jgi:hypothetical protein
MPDQTMKEAATELHGAVVALTELIEREYPSRREVERRFQSKSQSQNRLWLVFIVILLSVTFSYVMAISTVTTCFLSDNSPGICNAIPGYTYATDKENTLEEIILRLDKRSKVNDRRLDRLEKKVD